MTPSDSNQVTPVVSCGELDAATAAQLVATRLERFGTVGLSTLTGLENSRAAAKLLSFGNGSIIDPFIAKSQSDLHDAIVELRDEQLVAANVEVTTDSSVTYLLRPDTICADDAPPTALPATGGTGNAGGVAGSAGAALVLDPDCVERATEHPTRVRVSRIACDQGDNLAVEILYNPTSQRLLKAELYADRAEIDLYLGTYLGAATVTSTSISGGTGVETVETTTTKPLVTAAAGVVHGTLTLSGDHSAAGKISVLEAIDVTMADESAARIRLAAGTDLATIAADGTNKTIQVTANVGAFDWRSRFQDFISGMFGLNTSDAASSEAPVDVHVAGLRGRVTLNGATDVIVAEGLDLGAAAATATQGTRTLLSILPGSATHGALAATVSGRADDSVGLSLPAGMRLDIQYGLEPVLALLQNPANYLAKDKLTVAASEGASMTLLPEVGSETLALTNDQTGNLLRVDAGSLTMNSSLWPTNSVVVNADQCMNRTIAATSGHDLLDDFVIGACTQ